MPLHQRHDTYEIHLLPTSAPGQSCGLCFHPRYQPHSSGLQALRNISPVGEWQADRL